MPSEGPGSHAHLHPGLIIQDMPWPLAHVP